jgi:hypothetical protein
MVGDVNRGGRHFVADDDILSWHDATSYGTAVKFCLARRFGSGGDKHRPALTPITLHGSLPRAVRNPADRARRIDEPWHFRCCLASGSY